jgi:hypothetical protein
MLALTENETDVSFDLEWLPFSLSKGRELPDPETVRAAVLEGVAEANNLYKRNFQVTAVRYHLDGGTPKVFSYLAGKVIGYATGNAGS